MTTCYEWYSYLFTPDEVFNSNSESFFVEDSAKVTFGSL